MSRHRPRTILTGPLLHQGSPPPMPPKARLSPKDQRWMASVFQRLLGGRPGARILDRPREN